MEAASGSKNARSPDGAALPASVQQAAEPSPSSSPPDAAADDGSAETRRAGDEVDDEQVERFYALLANIRATRGVFRNTATTEKRKRAPVRGRGEEPPWRPAFRLEDFETEEVGSGAGAERRKKRRGCPCLRPRMPVGSETGAVAAGNDDDEDGGDDVVVERNGLCADQLDGL